MHTKGKSDNGNQLCLHHKYDSSNLSFSIKFNFLSGFISSKSYKNAHSPPESDFGRRYGLY